MTEKKISEIRKKMEIYSCNTFSITLNPREQHSAEDWKQRQELVETECKSRAARFLIPCLKDIILMFDMSFPREIYKGKIPRIHYHGKLKLKDGAILPFLHALGVLSIWYSIEVDTIEDSKVWDAYIYKSQVIKGVPSVIEYKELYDLYETKVKNYKSFRGKKIVHYLQDGESD